MRFGPPPLTIDDVMDRYPDGAYIPTRAAYYFLDYDGDLGYFIELKNGKFEDSVNYVDVDTMNEKEVEETNNIIRYLRDEM